MLSAKSIKTNFKNSIIRCKIANIQEAVTNIVSLKRSPGDCIYSYF
jgi:hypothetical protein